MSSTTTNRRQGVNAGSAVKVPCRAATTANITLSGEQTIDGVACVADDRVLVMDQNTGSENGIYVVSSSSWQRDKDFDGAFDVVQGTLVPVANGTVNGGQVFRVTTANPITIGTTSLAFTFALSAATLEFIQSGSGTPVTRTAQAKMREIVSLEDWTEGAASVAVRTTKFQECVTSVAVRGGEILADAEDYEITSVEWASGVYLRGKGSGKRASGAVLCTRIVGTAGSDIITFPDASVTDVAFLGLKFSGGRRHLYYNPSNVANRAITNLWVEDVHFSAPSDECIYIGGQSERQLFRYIYFANGTIGYYHGKGNRTDFGIFEKSMWEHLYFEGQSQNAIFFDTIANSGSTIVSFVKILSTGQTAVRIKGNHAGFNFKGWMFESCCTTGNSTNTTGTVGASSTALTVASGTGLADGDSITIRGAGTSGADHTTTIASGGGTVNIVLTDAAVTAVTSEYVTNRQYDLISFESVSGFGNPTNVTFDGGIIQDTSVSKARYAINNTDGWVNHGLLLNVGGSAGGQTGTPVYDPRQRFASHNSNIGIRVAVANGKPSFQRGEISFFPYGGTASTGEVPHTVIGTGRGQSCFIYLHDTNGVGTGTVGNIDVRTSDANVTRILLLNGTNATLSTRGKIQPGNFTSATGGATLKSEGTKGFIYGNAAPTAGTWVKGDAVINSEATVGQPIGWSCTVAGTPGTWVAWANL